MQRTVVIIDDDLDDIQFLTEAIAAVDVSIKCVSFENPLKAIETISMDESLQPSFVFIDFNMPRMSGEECLERLKEIGHLKATTFVINSTSMPLKMKKLLRGKGAAYAFKKKATVKSLNRIVNEERRPL
jgi:CheY-like chemotaxis protein